jgi:hypothetical protein
VRHARLVRRDRYAAWTAIDDFTRRASEHYFDQQFGQGKDHLDPDTAQAHLDRSTVDLSVVRRYVNRNTAHLRSDTESGGHLTFGRVEESLAILAGELDTLSLLTRGISIPIAEPVIQGPWRGAFFVPWALETIESIRTVPVGYDAEDGLRVR